MRYRPLKTSFFLSTDTDTATAGIFSEIYRSTATDLPKPVPIPLIPPVDFIYRFPALTDTNECFQIKKGESKMLFLSYMVLLSENFLLSRPGQFNTS